MGCVASSFLLIDRYPVHLVPVRGHRWMSRILMNDPPVPDDT
jgi:hypothetical protein